MFEKLSQFWRKLLFYTRRDRFDRELEEEMRFHLEMKAEENLAAGVSPEEARYTAQRQSRDNCAHPEDCKDRSGQYTARRIEGVATWRAADLSVLRSALAPISERTKSS